MPIVKSLEGNLFALFFGGEVAQLVDGAGLAIKVYIRLAILELGGTIEYEWNDFFADAVDISPSVIFQCLCQTLAESLGSIELTWNDFVAGAVDIAPFAILQNSCQTFAESIGTIVLEWDDFFAVEVDKAPFAIEFYR